MPIKEIYMNSVSEFQPDSGSHLKTKKGPKRELVLLKCKNIIFIFNSRLQGVGLFSIAT